MTKDQENTKQHPQVDLLLFHNFSRSSYTSSSKYNGTYSKNKEKNKCVCIHEIVQLIIMKMKMEMKKKSHKYDIIRPRSRHGHKYSKYKKFQASF